MTKGTRTYQWCIALLLCFVQTAGIAMYGQNRPRAAAKRQQLEHADSLKRLPQVALDSLNAQTESALQRVSAADSLALADSIAAENKKRLLEMTSSTTPQVSPTPTDSINGALNKKVFIPNPTKATWLALVIPGGGQIYNRKFWKLPIIYGGFAGCAYALTWNNKMYKDYMQAYKDAALGNWEANSIHDLLPPGYLDRTPKTQITETLRKQKDTYRRYRDLSIFAFIGVYLISVIDAYVDAELSNFDITPDLSMRVEPAVINSQYSIGSSNKSVGVQCSFRF
ncbi:uncharacterized protein BN604_01581 [Bacteroides intestinalis CAG:315]|jgi:hypothetical protein|uniref:DUF5683 domain-containing protein n=1 Tax=Bacteroides intestinalis TaxID=329854 RepID=A0A412XVU6_9BACE|nr:DUF5683 domain-containing protein [Bacteroides intestinalis]RGV49460.1 hypothetical protein DWW10_19835 [Bacteroides intestinalis]RHA57568.1 hypothetical protein DW932_17795 [Bacteroides intestinalis]RHE89106.1 hypothetical protein DW712_19995 [Bacteroides intestinalis]CDD93427.1 uncharacterized protein BN604_01581 [Bacteroides intestinalis CAG:315]